MCSAERSFGGFGGGSAAGLLQEPPFPVPQELRQRLDLPLRGSPEIDSVKPPMLNVSVESSLGSFWGRDVRGHGKFDMWLDCWPSSV